jgi:hypothetical protein
MVRAARAGSKERCEALSRATKERAMVEQLSGWALDEACARAMGHRLDTHYRGYTCIWPSTGESTRPLPAYSTDAATLPEMLAWLNDCSDFAGFNACTWPEDYRPGRPEWVWTTTFHYHKPDPRLNITRHGATLNEAVARLIVSVSEATK